MGDEVNQKRPYNSPRRQEQASATRRRILDAAQELFERDGYSATSMAAVAAAAGVASKTVYLTFSTKGGMLRALWHRLLRGDVEVVPVGDQEWFREVLDEPDPARQVQLNMRNSRAVKARAGGLMQVIRAAANVDPDVAELWGRIQTEFHANQRAVVESLAAKQALRPGLGVDGAADILWSLNHPDLYWLLTRERGWSDERYERWMSRLLCSELLGVES